MEREDPARGIPVAFVDKGGGGGGVATLAGYGPLPVLPKTSLDFRFGIVLS